MKYYYEVRAPANGSCNGVVKNYSDVDTDIDFILQEIKRTLHIYGSIKLEIYTVKE